MKKLFKSIKGSLLILVLFCIFLWLIRISITKSLFFGFLIWNLFLAIIPYCISTIVKDKMQQSSKLKLVLTLLIWLLFLPNAPYIITYFIHLHHGQGDSMSRMSELDLDIQYLLEKGKTAMDIARELEIPVSWVYEKRETAEEPQEVLSPFATINS